MLSDVPLHVAIRLEEGGRKDLLEALKAFTGPISYNQQREQEWFFIALNPHHMNSLTISIDEIENGDEWDVKQTRSGMHVLILDVPKALAKGNGNEDRIRVQAPRHDDVG